MGLLDKIGTAAGSLVGDALGGFGSLVGGTLGAVGDTISGGHHASSPFGELLSLNSSAMMHESDNMFRVGMAQVGQQMMQAQAMFTLGQAQIAAGLQQGREQLQNSLKIAELDYQARVDKQENDFEEKMGALDLRRYEIDHPATASMSFE